MLRKRDFAKLSMGGETFGFFLLSARLLLE